MDFDRPGLSGITSRKKTYPDKTDQIVSRLYQLVEQLVLNNASDPELDGKTLSIIPIEKFHEIKKIEPWESSIKVVTLVASHAY